MNVCLSSATYAALRQGGAPAAHVRAQLRLGPRDAILLERLFRARRGTGVRDQRPVFARHDAHVQAVLAEGGFPILAGRR